MSIVDPLAPRTVTFTPDVSLMDFVDVLTLLCDRRTAVVTHHVPEQLELGVTIGQLGSVSGSSVLNVITMEGEVSIHARQITNIVLG